MKPTRLLSIGLLLMSFWFISASQSVFASSYHSYAKDVYYIGVGGMPPTLTDFAVNPRAYLRSEAAFESLKQGFEEALNRSLSDEEFSELLVSDKVRAELKCEGRIRTSAIDKVGNMKWIIRDCYSNEYLIEVFVDNYWYVVASQGCFNLVESQVVLEPKKPLPAKPERVRRVRVINHPPAVVHIPGGWIGLENGHGINHGNTVYSPGTWIVTPRDQSTSIRLQ
jgi:hypothetical protein